MALIRFGWLDMEWIGKEGGEFSGDGDRNSQEIDQETVDRR